MEAKKKKKKKKKKPSPSHDEDVVTPPGKHSFIAFLGLHYLICCHESLHVSISCILTFLIVCSYTLLFYESKTTMYIIQIHFRVLRSGCRKRGDEDKEEEEEEEVKPLA